MIKEINRKDYILKLIDISPATRALVDLCQMHKTSPKKNPEGFLRNIMLINSYLIGRDVMQQGKTWGFAEYCIKNRFHVDESITNPVASEDEKEILEESMGKASNDDLHKTLCSLWSFLNIVCPDLLTSLPIPLIKSARLSRIEEIKNVQEDLIKKINPQDNGESLRAFMEYARNSVEEILLYVENQEDGSAQWMIPRKELKFDDIFREIEIAQILEAIENGTFSSKKKIENVKLLYICILGDTTKKIDCTFVDAKVGRVCDGVIYPTTAVSMKENNIPVPKGGRYVE